MRGSFVRLAVLFEGSLIVLAWVLGWFLGFPPFERFDLRWGALVWGVVATAPLLLGMRWCADTRWKPLSRLMREVEEKIVPLFSTCAVSELVLISVVAGVGEELLFRGVIQTTLSEWFGPWGGLLAASVVFGLGHMVTPAYAALAGLIGLYLGTLSMVFGNLLLVVVVHSLYDFVALVYLVKRQKRENRKLKAEE